MSLINPNTTLTPSFPIRSAMGNAFITSCEQTYCLWSLRRKASTTMPRLCTSRLYLMENYLEAADRVLDEAIVSGSRSNTMKKRFDIKDEKSVKTTGSVYRHVDDGVAIFSSWVSANIQVTLWQFQTRGRGKYRFRISGYGFQADKPVTFHVMAGPMNAAAQQYLIGYYSVPPGEPTVVEFVEQMESGPTIRIIADGLGSTPPQVEKVGAENHTGPGLLVQWVDIEGPILEGMAS